MRFHFNRAPDKATDNEYALLNDDGSETGISIQDCRSYGGGFSVNRYSGQDADFSVTFLATTNTLAEAKKIALEAADND